MSTPYGPGQHPTDPWGHPSVGQPHATTGATAVRRRRPGWLTVIISTVLAALMAAGLTVGATRALPTATDTPAITRVVQGDSANPDWTVTAAAAAPSVVSIQVSSGQGSAEGSGVVWDTSGRIVTNNHVVSALGEGATIQVTLASGQLHSATIIGTDVSTDLAVIQLDDAPADLTPITLGDASTLKVGAPVMALGNPLGLSETVTTGIVSALNRPVITQQESAQQESPTQQGLAASQQRAEQSVTSAIQTNAAINPGNSGGALVDANGALIGITSSIATLGNGSGESGNIGIGFAIPVNEVESVATQLINTGTAEHAWLGVATADARATSDTGTVIGAGIRTVSQGSPASRAGLAEGDVITAVDGRSINGSQGLMALIRSYPTGHKLALTVNRNGVSREVTVDLGTAPA